MRSNLLTNMHYFTFVRIQLHFPFLISDEGAFNEIIAESSISVSKIRPNSTNDFSIISERLLIIPIFNYYQKMKPKKAIKLKKKPSGVNKGFI